MVNNMINPDTNKLPDTRVSFCGLELDNPVIPASGTFGFGRDFADLYDINILGSLSFKGTTPEERYGNNLPRIAECPCGMLNSVGLQNPGVQAVIEKELPALAKIYKKPVIANISGFSTDDYVACAKAMDNEKQVGIIEVNISCPNVHNGGMAFGTVPESAEEVTRAVKAVTSKPVVMKLSPNVTDITDIAKACEAGGADGISLINTVLGMRIDIAKRKPILANKVGGYSGPGLFPIALRMVYQVARAVNIPVMGMGGIQSADDVLEMIMAGASAVQIGAANLVNPYICREIIEELPIRMNQLGIKSLKEITGAAD